MKHPTPTVTGAELTEQIHQALVRDERVSSQHINVEVVGGAAILTGTVSSYRRKLAAHKIAAAYEGVREVRNCLTVQPSENDSDVEIVERVRAALDGSADVTKETVCVEVIGGKATLTGTVGSLEERAAAEDVARGVRGIRDVINALSVDLDHKIDDHELMNSVQAALGRAKGLRDTSVRAALADNTVILSGSVDDEWKREVAETVVGRFGLLHVRNEIRVE